MAALPCHKEARIVMQLRPAIHPLSNLDQLLHRFRFYLIHSVFKSDLVSSQSEHILTEHIELALDRIKFLTDCVNFGKRSLPYRLCVKRFRL